MNNILVTAIGSMSAPNVLETLSKDKENLIVGTDIYPKQWQINDFYLSKFYQVPKANDENYISEILKIGIENEIKYIIPLTDPEVDILSEKRELFENSKIVICISEKQTILKCRDKAMIENTLKHLPIVNVINSFLEEELEDNSIYPVIAKPKKGRSSEGLYLLKNKKWLSIIENRNDYVFQPYLQGQIITVDVVRDKNGKNVSMARRELVRTSNGTGLIVEIIKDPLLEQIVTLIADELNILGCINIEFLQTASNYHLMDINPRFSAGVGFSFLAGYDFVINHLKCFKNETITNLGTIKKGILSKKTQTVYI
jgi:carbamoyl-phosphate synthase large subunit